MHTHTLTHFSHKSRKTLMTSVNIHFNTAVTACLSLLMKERALQLQIVFSQIEQAGWN